MRNFVLALNLIKLLFSKGLSYLEGGAVKITLYLCGYLTMYLGRNYVYHIVCCSLSLSFLSNVI